MDTGSLPYYIMATSFVNVVIFMRTVITFAKKMRRNFNNRILSVTTGLLDCVIPGCLINIIRFIRTLTPAID